MKHSKIPLAQTVVQMCKLKKIKHIVISPGSRNAPLTLEFTHDDFFTCYSIVDERCAAFFALGIAQQTTNAVALVCTSGSALLNYYPAIAEAFYSRIPLVVLSADRPKYLINIGDGQTIDQKHVYGEHSLYDANLKLDLNEDMPLSDKDELPIIKSIENKLERFLGLQQDIQDFNETELNEALNRAQIKKGPVHVNVPFDEPLYDMTDTLMVNPEIEQIALKERKVNSLELKECVAEWYQASKKMVLVGVSQPNVVEQQWLDELADDDSVIVLTETTSNLHHNSSFPSIDKLIAPLSEDEFKMLQPDILVTFGGMIVSKKIKAFLRKYQPKHHWHIDPHQANDTFFCLDKHIETTPNQFFSQFLPKVTHITKSDYQTYWDEVKARRHKKHKQYMEQIPFSDLKVFHHVLKALPKQSTLQLGNSSAVRYAQLFNIHRSISVFCNRGTSGIDGCTSTAIGCAVAINNPTTLITGDLSFLYDSNALWNDHIPSSFRIILINNGGGGIFRILPGHKNTENFDRFFETTHKLTAKQLCDMYHFEYVSAVDVDTLKSNLDDFYATSKQPKLLEIFTPRELNDTILLKYFDFIK